MSGLVLLAGDVALLALPALFNLYFALVAIPIGFALAVLVALGKGSRNVYGDLTFSVTNAFHSSSTPDGAYAGEPLGFVVRLEDGRSIYFSGDTSVFGAMALIKRQHPPTVAVLPIGNMYTMDPIEAGLAAELLGVQTVVPGHWGTFPALDGTPEELRKHVPAGVTVLSPEPGVAVAV